MMLKRSLLYNNIHKESFVFIDILMSLNRDIHLIGEEVINY